jgi:hypothetical protein
MQRINAQFGAASQNRTVFDAPGEGDRPTLGRDHTLNSALDPDVTLPGALPPELTALEPFAPGFGLTSCASIERTAATDVIVPPHVAPLIGRHFDFDMITAKSPVRDCPSPLCVVIRHCVELFRLESMVPTEKMMRRLMAYTLRLERGYMDDGYHCKRHAADVTNRFATILWHTGIADAASPREMMPALVAAALHDYKHPQVTNNFLVLRVNPLNPHKQTHIPA